jgi:hypothetical protein
MRGMSAGVGRRRRLGWFGRQLGHVPIPSGSHVPNFSTIIFFFHDWDARQNLTSILAHEPFPLSLFFSLSRVKT